MPYYPRILAIAGSDSGGGAGIQADIKTISMLGGYAMTAVTAITAQNTQKVQSIHAISETLVTEQCQLVINDIGVDAIKIGMVQDSAVIRAVSAVINNLSIPIVLDPVMVATSGDNLLNDDALSSLEELLPYATLITPNIPEAEMLSKQTIQSADDMALAVEILAKRYDTSVLIKGGHLRGDIIYDLLRHDEKASWFESPRIDSRHTHGTGCTLSSAIATYLGHGELMIGAVALAREYVHQAIATAPGFGKGHGPLNHSHPLIAFE